MNDLGTMTAVVATALVTVVLPPVGALIIALWAVYAITDSKKGKPPPS